MDLAHAGSGDLSFLANPKYRAQFDQTRAGAVLVPEGTSGGHTTLIVCADPYLALAVVTAELHPAPALPAGIEPGAHVHAEARVDPTATIRVAAVVDARATVGARSRVGPGCYVGRDARLGDDVVLHAGAKVLDGCVLGDRVILQAGAVIGSDGFGYAADAQGRRHKIPQVGIVELEEDVEIGANTTIDRAAFGVTRIGAGSKIDNLVQIAHNVTLGRDCVVVSQSGIAGSTSLGDRVVVGAQAGLVGHIHVGDGVTLAARTGVAHDIRDAGVYSGVPAMSHRLWLRVAAAQKAVPELLRRVRQLEERLLQSTGGRSS
jgi:UDP-3-O-[3-hydroxymyristoyl] glucosamine N-acyltransferase